MYIDRLIREVTELGEILRTNTDEIGLSDLVVLKLKQMDILTVFDLVQKVEVDLIRQKGFKKTSINQIADRLKAHGLRFGMSFDSDFVDEFVLFK